jgi:hypothetical protein
VGPGSFPTFFLIAAFALPGQAEPANSPNAQLQYQRHAGAEHCPDGESLAEQVKRNLGEKALDEEAERTVRASVVGRDDHLFAHIEMVGKDGQSLGERHLKHADAEGDCRALAEAMVLSICIAIDPLGAAFLPGADAAAEMVVEAQPAGPDDGTEKPLENAEAELDRLPSGWGMSARVEKPQEEKTWGLVLYGAAHGGAGYAPSLAPGVDLGAALSYRALSVALEARVVGPGLNFADAGFLGAVLWAGNLLPCLSVSGIGTCALLSVGALSGISAQPNATVFQTDFYLAAGSRLFVTAPILPGFSSRIFIEGTLPLFRPSYRVVQTGGTLWEMSGPSLLAGVTGAMDLL